MEVKGVYMKMRGSQDRAGHKVALGAESRDHVPCTHRDCVLLLPEMAEAVPVGELGTDGRRDSRDCTF